MPTISIEVEPKSKNNVGWDVFCVSWDNSQESLNIHELNWTDKGNGKFAGTTADLPSGVYGALVELIGVGREIKVTVNGKPPVLQPKNKTWPMEAKVSPNQTRKTAVWYFQI